MEFPVKKRWTGEGRQIELTFTDHYTAKHDDGIEYYCGVPCTDYRWVDVYDENEFFIEGKEHRINLQEVFNDLKESKTTRGDGGTTSYYELPKDAKELGDLIYHKEMNHSIGEAFCALYRLKDNGEYARNLRKAKYYIDLELSRVDG